MDERSFWTSLVISIGMALFYLWALALMARHAQPIPGFASDLTQPTPQWSSWDKSVKFFSGNAPILACFGALLCLCVAVRNRAENHQWNSALLVLAGAFAILAVFSKKLVPALASVAYANGLDPVALLARLPHGVFEFAAFQLPVWYAVITLIRTGRLPGPVAALLCFMSAAVLLWAAAFAEGHITPLLLPALN